MTPTLLLKTKGRLLLAASLVAGAALTFGALNRQPAHADTTAAAPLPARVDNFMLVDQNLRAHELHRLKDAPAVVIVTQGNGCPVSRNLGPALKAFKAAYAPKGVEFLMLNPNLQDSREAVAAEAKEYGYDIPIMLDENQLISESLGVTRTAEVFVIDPKSWKVVYRGPLDDRVTYERQKASAEHAWATDAVDALVAGKTVTVASRESPGCLIDFPERDRAAEHSKISYAKEIAPIIEGKCIACHQAGGIGPMPLTNYTQVKGFSPMIREVIRTDRMPPWRADPHVGSFKDDMSLSNKQIKTMVHWIEAGAPRGAGKDPLAAVEHVAPEWPLGKPDLVLDIPAYTIPASGIVDYQRPVVANPLTEGKWLRASTIKVGQRQGVHHFLTGYMKEMPRDGVGNESRWGQSVGGYAVGAESTVEPKDIGVYVPAGGAIGFQAHYTPFGKEVVDKSQMALYFHDKQPKLMMRNAVIADPTISIPPGEARHEEIGYLLFPKDALLYSAFPHAHYRGSASNLTLRYPDGSEKLLLSLSKYDFNWQRAYDFATPIKVPAGSKLIARYIYDNSPRNPANPDPKRTVPWGDQSFDEMFYTALRYRWVDETTAKQTNYDELLQSTRLMGIMDDNLNGKMEMAELRGPMGAGIKGAFATIDANKDGGLDTAELQAANALLRGGRRGAPPPAAR